MRHHAGSLDSAIARRQHQLCCALLVGSMSLAGKGQQQDNHAAVYAAV